MTDEKPIEKLERLLKEAADAIDHAVLARSQFPTTINTIETIIEDALAVLENMEGEMTKLRAERDDAERGRVEANKVIARLLKERENMEGETIIQQMSHLSDEDRVAILKFYGYKIWEPPAEEEG